MKRFYGAHGPATAWTVNSLLDGLPRVLLVTPDEARARALKCDLSAITWDKDVWEFPHRASLPFEMVNRDLESAAYRNWCLNRILSEEPGIFIISATALLQSFLPIPWYHRFSRTIQAGDSMDRESIVAVLEEYGYLETANVQEVGEYAIRGGKIDLYPAAAKNPIRVEFLANTVNGIGFFCPVTQRSVEGNLSSLEIFPVREFLTWNELLHFSEKSEHELTQCFKDFAHRREVPPRESIEVLKALQQEITLPGIELYQHILPLRWGSWLDIDIPTILIDEVDIIQEIELFHEIMNERESRLKEQHYLIPNSKQLFAEPEKITQHLLSHALASVSQTSQKKTTAASAEKIASYALSELRIRQTKVKRLEHPFQPLRDKIREWRNKNYRLAFLIGSEHRSRRLQRILNDFDIEVPIRTDLSAHTWAYEFQRLPIVILSGNLSSGVLLPDEALVFISERDLFGEASHIASTPSVSMRKLLNSLSQLTPGDYIVHIDYGIGRYRGFTQRDVKQGRVDLLEIEYADSTLFLPMTNIAKVQRYSGVDGTPPQIDRLSSKRWNKTKAKVRASVELLAGELVDLYAKRKLAKGWRFDPAGAQDEEFADGFPFTETSDQLKAIEETLLDMSSEQPMDRLICGDVGFGKTEVALRAAFKATQHSKQVAILCPTTILAEQHFKTFNSRLAEFPVNIGIVSRFYSSKQNQNTLEQLSSGQLDIIIGTHKLLQRDVTFHDLGLLIIDEEHRFGVRQKEKLKQMKGDIDVLTLTATPIPRTLHMSLLQIRDISIISSPPVNRKTIRTFVTPDDDNTIRDALLREMQRGGQAFFLHNRVQSIQIVTERLQQLLPDARIVFAHGQMSESQLEDIMRRFLQHEIDILVATTIIESGIDIPNANTIIIHRANTFGLAQLYQIRGRVGRSTRQAYCYFLTPTKKRLSGEAQERLAALQSLDELGHGFQLAIRDLEIRGAGELLGRQQSGSVISVGFELYTKILDEAVHHLTGEALSHEFLVEPEVKIELDAFLPPEYIPDIQERMVIYQRLTALRSNDDANGMRDELQDRFGPLSTPTEQLIDIMTFRGQLKPYGVARCEIGDETFSCAFAPSAPISIKKALELVRSNSKKFKLGKNDSFTVHEPTLRKGSLAQTFDRVFELLDQIQT